MAIKEYYSPTSLAQAAQLVTDSRLPARFFAGGTDLMIQMMEEGSPETRLISLKNIAGLKDISRNEKGEIFIGAMVSHAEVAGHSLTKRYFPALAEAAGLVGSPSIRNMGTIGGNICNSSPSADTAPPLIAYEAEVVIWRQGAEVIVNVGDFFKGPSENILMEGDIIKGFLLEHQEGMNACYEKLGKRKAMEIGIVNVCVAMGKDDKGYCNLIRIALGAVAPTPIRAKEAEEILDGEKISPSLIRKATETAMKETSPISDVRASAAYRRDMVGVLVEKAITSIEHPASLL